MYKHDCFGSPIWGSGCSVLKETLCSKGDGKCPFYATKSQVAMNRANSMKVLAEKRLKPIIKHDKNDPTNMEGIQSVEPY